MKDEERGADGKRQDHASGHLVKRSVDIFKGKVAQTATSISQIVTLFIENTKANLRPTTLRLIIGMSPCIVCLSRCNGTLSKPAAWHARNSSTARMSWANKKNRGASVEFRTHLLLRESYQGVVWMIRAPRQRTPRPSENHWIRRDNMGKDQEQRTANAATK